MNQTITHHRPHWHRHQCPGSRLPVIKQDRKLPLLSNQQSRQEMKKAASVWQSASLPCNYALWGVGPHMLKHKHTVTIAWDREDSGKLWFIAGNRMIHVHLSLGILFFYGTSHLSSSYSRPPELHHGLSLAPNINLLWRKLMSSQHNSQSVLLSPFVAGFSNFLNLCICLSNCPVFIDFKSKQWFC